MSLQKFKEGTKVKVGSGKLSGVVTKAKEQRNGWAYEVKLDQGGALATYLEWQIGLNVAVPRGIRA